MKINSINLDSNIKDNELELYFIGIGFIKDYSQPNRIDQYKCLVNYLIKDQLFNFDIIGHIKITNVYVNKKGLNSCYCYEANISSKSDLLSFLGYVKKTKFNTKFTLINNKCENSEMIDIYIKFINKRKVPIILNLSGGKISLGWNILKYNIDGLETKSFYLKEGRPKVKMIFDNDFSKKINVFTCNKISQKYTNYWKITPINFDSKKILLKLTSPNLINNNLLFDKKVNLYYKLLFNNEIINFKNGIARLIIDNNTFFIYIIPQCGSNINSGISQITMNFYMSSDLDK